MLNISITVAARNSFMLVTPF